MAGTKIKKATVLDVAKKAGVSTASVSRVVNNPTSVALPTRTAVLAAIKTLNYVPHSAGRALATSRNNMIGVILPDIYGEYFSELVRGIDLAAREHNQHILVASSHGDGNEARKLIRQMHGRVDGMIIMSPYLLSEEMASAVPIGTPAILLNSAQGSLHPSITVDNAAGAAAAVAHLLAIGRRKIAFISGPNGNIEAEQRLDGYQTALKTAELDIKPVILDGDFSEAAGARAGEIIAKRPHDFDAVFAANDMMALGCLSILNREGINVPDDVALVGFDDVPLARFVNPALTTMGVNITKMGQNALDRVMAQIKGEKEPENTTTILPNLIVRSSCGSNQ